MAVVAAAIGLAGGFGGPLDTDPRPTGHPSATDGLVAGATGVDVAVVPARTEAGGAGVRSAADPTRTVPARWLLPLVAVLLGLAGLLGARSGGVVRPPAGDRLPLRARRHAIALRAPPSLRSV
jgi:hypothetical protein